MALPEGARVHGMRREPMLDDAEGNRFGVVVWGGNFASALALRVPTCIDEEETIESASESDASSSSRTTGLSANLLSLSVKRSRIGCTTAKCALRTPRATSTGTIR